MVKVTLLGLLFSAVALVEAMPKQSPPERSPNEQSVSLRLPLLSVRSRDFLLTVPSCDSRSRCLASAYTRARVTNRTNATINPTALDQRKWTSCPTGARSAMQNFCAAPTGKPYRIRFRATGAWGVTTISASELLSCSNLAGRHPTAIDGRRARHFKQLKDATLSAKAERIGS